MPLKSTNLAHYFRRGCICPAKYLDNRVEDIQNIYDNALLLSRFKFTNETNCSIEIVLNSTAEKVKQISENFFVLEMPLPISRVKKVFFQEEKQKKTTVFNITSGAAFISDNLLEVVSSDQSITVDEFKESPSINSKRDWTKIIEYFDQLMGGFALMRIAGDDIQNYPTNYFNTLSSISQIVKDELIHQKVKNTRDFQWTIINNNKDTTDLFNAIYSKIEDSTVNRFAQKYGTKIELSNMQYVLDKIDQQSPTYLVAVLASYGEGTRRKIDEFISHFISNKFSERRKESLALIFGLNKGYKALRNRYKIQNQTIDIKFKLDSQLDYYTIESIYQFVFNNKRDNNAFEYIDSWCSKWQEDNAFKGYETYEVLDKTIVYKKKEEVEKDSFSVLFQKYSRNKIYEKITVEISKWIPPYLLKDNKEAGNEYFKALLDQDLEEFARRIYETGKAVIEERHNLQIKNQKEEATKDCERLSTIVQSKDKKIIQLKQRIQELEQEIEINSRKSAECIEKKQNENKPNSESIGENKAEQLTETKSRLNLNVDNVPLQLSILEIEKDSRNIKVNNIEELESIPIENKEGDKDSTSCKVDHEKSIKGADKNNPELKNVKHKETVSKSHKNQRDSIGSVQADLYQQSCDNLLAKEQRGQNLYERSIGDLKEIARKLEVKKWRKYKKSNKSELVDEILKIEFK